MLAIDVGRGDGINAPCSIDVDRCRMYRRVLYDWDAVDAAEDDGPIPFMTPLAAPRYCRSLALDTVRLRLGVLKLLCPVIGLPNASTAVAAGLMKPTATAADEETTDDDASSVSTVPKPYPPMLRIPDREMIKSDEADFW